LRLFLVIVMFVLLAACERKVSVKLSVKTRDAGLVATSTAGRR
jgi:hypothetical protein